MYIILMRHSMATVRKESTSDDMRELTEKGRKKLLKVAQGTKKLLFSPVVLHSSPLIRAFQSAEIVSGAFDNAPIRLADELVDGNYKEFFNNLSNDLVHIAIGHEPYLSEWLYEFTGVKQSFKKAAFALIEIKENTEIHFICYIQASDITHLIEGKEWFDLLNKWLDVIHEMDSENITEMAMHQYRILLRAFDTLVYSTKKQSKIIIPVQLESLIHTLLDQTGEIREIDVLLNELEKQSKIVQLLAPLREKREEMVKQWKINRQEVLSTQLLELMLFGLMTQYDHLTKKKIWIRDQFNHLVGQVGKKVVDLDLNQDIQIHDIRLMMKKIVYMANYNSNYLSDNNLHIGEYAKEINGLAGAYLDYKKHCFYLDQMVLDYPELKNDIEDFKDKLDSRIPSSFAIHKMIYRFGKKIGVK